MNEEVASGMTARAFHVSEGVEDWRVIGDGACAFYRTSTFAGAARLVQAISELPRAEAHRPDIDVRADGVTVRLLTYEDEYYGMSRADLELAREISKVAHEQGLVPEPTAVQNILVVPGTPSAVADVMPFWQAVLGYEPRKDSPAEDLVDPRNRAAPFWFEHMEQPRGDGGGAIHIAVWVPPEVAEARVAAALPTGGHVVRDEFAPMWWTLADSAGNEVDVSAVLGREEG